MQYHEFLATVRDRGQYADQEEAGRIATAVAEVLATRLTPGEAGDLAAQLPGPLGATLASVGSSPAASFGAEEFCERVADLTGARPRTAEWDASAVLTTVADAVSDGQLNHLLSQLPADYAPLFGRAGLAG